MLRATYLYFQNNQYAINAVKIKLFTDNHSQKINIALIKL